MRSNFRKRLDDIESVTTDWVSDLNIIENLQTADQTSPLEHLVEIRTHADLLRRHQRGPVRAKQPAQSAVVDHQVGAGWRELGLGRSQD